MDIRKTRYLALLFGLALAGSGDVAATPNLGGAALSAAVTDHSDIEAVAARGAARGD